MSIIMTDEMEKKVTAFCQKYIVLTEVLYRDRELRDWCRRHSSCKRTDTHLALEQAVYSMAEEAYQTGFFGQVLSSKPYDAYSLAETLDGTKADLMYGIFLEIRMDYSGGDYLIPSAIAKGRLYRLMKTYLEYDARREGERGFRMEYLPQEEPTEGSRPPHTVYVLQNGDHLIKIDHEKRTAYRFDFKKKEWNEVLSLYVDYAYGNVLGEHVWIDDIYEER